MDQEKIYFGSDSGFLWALDKVTGRPVWKFKVGFHVKGKSIFSSPVLYQDILVFGSYDGNIYGINKNTGKKVWVNFEADWIGSSPCISKELGIGFVGLEFGIFRRRGGIMAFDLLTGKKIWSDISICYSHASPFYIKEKKQVVIGGNDGVARLYDTKTGKNIWNFSPREITDFEKNKGFSGIDIKEGFAYYKDKNYLIFGNIEGSLFILNAKNGEKIYEHKAEFGFFSTPLVFRDKVYASSVDKKLYCINLKTLKEEWVWSSRARIFSSPVEIEGSIFIGSNNGKVTELDPNTGSEISFITVPERVTGQIIYDKENDFFYLPTFANEIYKIKKIKNDII